MERIKRSLLFDMSDETYEEAVSYEISRIFRGIQESYSYEKLMEQMHAWVFVVGPYIDDYLSPPKGGLEHGIFMENIDGKLSSWIAFELCGHLYTLGRDKKFRQKIDRFKEIGQKLFLDNNDLTNFEFIKLTK